MRLSTHQQLALGRRWIKRSDLPVVKAAAAAGYAVYWACRVKVVCGTNAGVEQHPESWLDLAEDLGMSRGNFSRYFPQYDGKDHLKKKFQMPDPSLQHRIALSLRVEKKTLDPDDRIWMAETVKWLGVLQRRVSYRDKSDQYLPYCDYLLAELHDDHGDRICSRGLDHARQQHPATDADQLRQEITDVAQMVGEILAELGMEPTP